LKMPAGRDLIVVVAFATGFKHGDRLGLPVRRLDRDAFFVVERNQMGNCSTISVMAIPEALTLFSRTRGYQHPGKQYPENQYPNGTNIQRSRYG